MSTRPIPAASVSQWAESQLSAHPTGAVHSVYKNTVNLSCGDALISLLSGGNRLTHPFSVCAESLDTSTLRVGDPFSYADMLLSVGGSAVSLETAERVNTDMPPASGPLSGEAFALLQEQAERFAPNSALGFLILPTLASPLSHWEVEFRRLAMAVISGNDAAAAAVGDRILGMGWGLTPTADDFCVGVLAAFFGFRRRPERSEPFRELSCTAKARTNQISYNFLAHACSARFSRPILYLAEALSRRDEALIRQAAEEAAAIGHSSGSDMLMGAALATKYETEGI